MFQVRCLLWRCRKLGGSLESSVCLVLVPCDSSPPSTQEPPSLLMSLLCTGRLHVLGAWPGRTLPPPEESSEPAREPDLDTTTTTTTTKKEKEKDKTRQDTTKRREEVVEVEEVEVVRLHPPLSAGTRLSGTPASLTECVKQSRTWVCVCRWLRWRPDHRRHSGHTASHAHLLARSLVVERADGRAGARKRKTKDGPPLIASISFSTGRPRAARLIYSEDEPADTRNHANARGREGRGREGESVRSSSWCPVHAVDLQTGLSIAIISFLFQLCSCSAV